MLKYLKINNLAVIEEAELEVDASFICITGESGAGKSVIIEALLLLGGGRGSSDLVRAGCSKAVVEAEFELDHHPAKFELLEGPQLFLRREISAEGKSRAFVNGVMVSNNVLGAYAVLAFEIYGQHGQQRLLKEKNHSRIFDDQTGLQLQQKGFAQVLADFRQRLAGFWELKDGEAQRLKEIDFLKLQIKEIERVGPNEDDLDLDLRLKKARNQELIRASRHELQDLLGDRLIPDLKRVLQRIQDLAEFEPKLLPYGEQIEALAATLSDLRADTDAWQGMEDADTLAALEARESALNRLFLKYGQNVEEVLAELDRLQTQLKDHHHATESLDERWRDMEIAYRALLEQRRELHQARQQSTGVFSKAVRKELADLALSEADFQVDYQWPAWPEELPSDRNFTPPLPQLRFLFSSNPGEPVKPLAKVASGGELSRVLLALINTLSRPPGGLLVFDEVDAGLGGETAHRVGAKLAALGRRHQVLCVTHFAQVARFAGQHLKIGKTTRAGRTFMSLIHCDYEQRVAELARLMGGDAEAENLRDHARQLIGQK